ncbi:hypothetical protein Tco_1435103, partial [Tanacetum coccineum]
IEASVQANLINKVKNQLPKFLPKIVSDFVNPRLESMVRNVLQKTPALLAQSSSTPGQSSSKVAECLFENEESMKKAFQDMLHGLGEVNPTHAYYNGSRTSKDNEDPSWSTSFKTRRTRKTTLALEVL